MFIVDSSAVRTLDRSTLGVMLDPSGTSASQCLLGSEAVRLNPPLQPVVLRDLSQRWPSLESALACRLPRAELAVVALALTIPYEQLSEQLPRLVSPWMHVQECAWSETDKMLVFLVRAVDQELVAKLALHVEQLTEQGKSVRAGIARWPQDGKVAALLLAGAGLAAQRAAAGKIETLSQIMEPVTLGAKRILLGDRGSANAFARLRRLAPCNMPVLILGETGAGKEAAAQALHEWADRSQGKFVAFNCASIPESLAEPELFGTVRGAATGSVDRPGLLEYAHGGTVFLDEVGELSLGMQAKLLRVLETKKIRRVGALQEKAIEVRIVAATNRNLDQEVAAGRFRADLLFRFGAARIVLPALRNRKYEIPLLAQAFLHQATPPGKQPAHLCDESLEVLMGYQWPGNVRELRNLIEYIAVIDPGEVIGPMYLREQMETMRNTTHSQQEPIARESSSQDTQEVEVAPGRRTPPSQFRPIAEEIRALERRLMVEALRASWGVKLHAAALLSMASTTFKSRLREYDIQESEYRDPG